MKNGIRLLGENFQHVKWIDPRTRLTMLAEGTVGKVYRAKDGSLSVDPALGRSDGTVKICTRPSQEIGSDLPSENHPSQTTLTLGDMHRNAAGCVDTPKKALVRRLRKTPRPDGTFPNIPASIRYYGRDAYGKPHAGILGNSVDCSMSRVEAWYSASAEGARTVVVSCGKVIGSTAREIGPRSTFVW